MQSPHHKNCQQFSPTEQAMIELYGSEAYDDQLRRLELSLYGFMWGEPGPPLCLCEAKNHQ